MDRIDKESRFDIYCDSCKYKNLPAFEDPCNDCLTETVNEESHKPVRHQKDGYYINYLEPDGITYTRDYKKSKKGWKPTPEELKKNFEKHDDGDYYEKKEQ